MGGADRRVEQTVTVEATREAIWQALTDAAELTRWFPFQASVTPGAGGRIRYSWDGAFDWAGRIAIWEPGTRLQVTLPVESGHDARGQPDPTRPLHAELTLDFHIEAHRGQTVVRVVHAGFGRGADWDDEFDGVNRGWQVELLCLKHYLERHAGFDRSVAWPIAESAHGPKQTWPLVVGPHGVCRVEGLERLEQGDSLRIQTPSGDLLEGTLLLHHPGWDLVVGLLNWNGGIFRASLVRLKDRCAVHLWLSAWNVDRAAVNALGDRLRQVLTQAVAEDPVSRVRHGERT
jgi:uncharacterized protein YndB with AHSA1/START domain